MKIVHIADIHINESRNQEFEEMLSQLAEGILDQAPDLIVFAGDMFIHRDRLTPRQVELTRWFFKDKLGAIPNIIIPGNHDSSMSATKVDSLSAVFSHDSVTVYTEIGSYIDIDDTRFHMFGYPSSKELSRLGLSDIAEVGGNKDVFDRFELSEDKNNILVFHGTLESFMLSDTHQASEAHIGVGKDLILAKEFWNQFDYVMAGHLHKYQSKGEKAVYCGAPFPLNFADDSDTGYIVWDNFTPKFVPVSQIYPYLTYNLGDLSRHVHTRMTSEIVRRLGSNTFDCSNTRIRIKYSIDADKASLIQSAKLASYFKDPKEIKIVPTYIETTSTKESKVSIEDFQQHKVSTMITDYITTKKYDPPVFTIAEEVEKALLELEESTISDDRGIHFKPHHLTISNFKCFSGDPIEIDFDSLNAIVGIFGPNKTGKSALVETILWALFGKTLRNKTADSILPNNRVDDKVEACVELIFGSGSDKLKVIRTRRVNGGNLKLYHLDEENVWVDISGATNTITQKNIETLVGTMDLLLSTMYSPQSGIDLLIKKRPDQRKQVILDCMQIDVLSKRQKQITTIIGKVRDDISQKKGKLNVYSEKVVELIADNPHDRLASFEKLYKENEETGNRLADALSVLQKQYGRYETLIGTYEQLERDLLDLKKKRGEINKTLTVKRNELHKFESMLDDPTIIEEGLQRIALAQKNIDSYVAEQQLIIERRKNIKHLQNELKAVTLAHEQVIEQIEKRTDMLNDQLKEQRLLNCSKPDCPLNKTVGIQREKLQLNIDKANEEINTQILAHNKEVAGLRQAILAIEKEIAESFYDGAKHTNMMRAIGAERNNHWEDLQTKISNGAEIVENMRELIAVYEDQVNRLDAEVISIVSERTKLSSEIKVASTCKTDIRSIQTQLHTVEKNRDNYQQQIFDCKAGIEEISKNQKLMAAISEQLEDMARHLTYCQQYQTIVSKTGVIYGLVDKAIPIIEKFAQDLLADTTNGDISLSMESFKTQKKGFETKKTDEISIYISDAKGTRDVLEGSGAEQTLVSLVLRAAMAHLLSLRMGSKVELFVIDEGIGTLDEEHVVIVKNMFRELGQRFHRILLITHVGSAKDIAQSVIELSSNNVRSFVNVIPNAEIIV